MFVSVSLEEWADLQGKAAKLEALEAAGVDNWEGYESALLLLHEGEEEEEYGDGSTGHDR